jgi:hypothetical protein
MEGYGQGGQDPVRALEQRVQSQMAKIQETARQVQDWMSGQAGNVQRLVVEQVGRMQEEFQRQLRQLDQARQGLEHRFAGQLEALGRQQQEIGKRIEEMGRRPAPRRRPAAKKRTTRKRSTAKRSTAKRPSAKKSTRKRPSAKKSSAKKSARKKSTARKKATGKR